MRSQGARRGKRQADLDAEPNGAQRPAIPRLIGNVATARARGDGSTCGVAARIRIKVRDIDPDEIAIDGWLR
jgi:hypothetical protein